MAAALLPTAVAGSVLVERLFSMRGAGELLAEAVFARDYPTVLGLTVLVAVVVVTGSFLADLASALLDPRMRETFEAEAAVPA
jgi:peptide/nickel transport system permease protein